MAGYETIRTITIDNHNTTSVTFSSIPQTFLHLEVSFYGCTTEQSYADTLWMKFNGVTGNHWWNIGYGAEVSKASSAATGQDGAACKIDGIGVTSAADFGVTQAMCIYDYTDANKNHGCMGVATREWVASGVTTAQVSPFSPFFGGGPYLYFLSGGYDNAVAVTSLKLQVNGSDYYQKGARFTLRGFKSS